MSCSPCKKSWKDGVYVAALVAIAVLVSELAIVPAVKRTGVLEAHYQINVDCPCKSDGDADEVQPVPVGDYMGQPDEIPHGAPSQGLILPSGRSEL